MKTILPSTSGCSSGRFEKVASDKVSCSVTLIVRRLSPRTNPKPLTFLPHTNYSFVEALLSSYFLIFIYYCQHIIISYAPITNNILMSSEHPLNNLTHFTFLISLTNICKYISLCFTFGLIDSFPCFSLLGTFRYLSFPFFFLSKVYVSQKHCHQHPHSTIFLYV